MTPLRVSIFAAIAAIFLLALIFELIRSRRLQERYALLWLATGGVILFFSLWRGALGTCGGSCSASRTARRGRTPKSPAASGSRRRAGRWRE